MLLISLVGEQPIPILLPVRRLAPEENLLVYTARTERVARRLRRLISGSPDLTADLKVEPYALDAIQADLQARLLGRTDLAFNLTGGTKPMFLAAYTLAQRFSGPFVYLESEQSRSRMQRFEFQAGLLARLETEDLPALISIEDYLLAQVDSYKVEGPHCGTDGRLDSGGRFEQAVADALEKRLDQALAGVRPSGAAGQIEIDLLVRCGNQVGVAELKLSGDRDLNKRGLDQLKMAAEATYLGTYTAQFLIIGAAQLNDKLARLAGERGITVIPLPEYQEGQPLPSPVAERLAEVVRRRLQPPSRL